MIADEALIYGLTASTAGCAAAAAWPLASRLWAHVAGRVEQFQHVKVEKAAKELDDLFVEVKPHWLNAAYGLAPLAAGVLLYALTHNVPLVCVGVALGVITPDLVVRQTRAVRRLKFNAQLVDALFILSSSLRAGLSMTQAFEQLEAELAPPASQEFGLMMKAHRLGLTLEESLQRLNERMPSEELNLVTTAVLVGRETGGDVTRIIHQLVMAIRERKKLKDKVMTLTLQGRLQAYIMSALPVLFTAFVRSSNPHYFDIMLEDPVGRTLLALAGGLWVVGMILLMKMSKVAV